MEEIELIDHSGVIPDSQEMPFSFEKREKFTDQGKDEIGYVEATKDYVLYALPSVVGMLLRRSPDIINYLIIGQMDDPAYASGLGLAIMTFNIVIASLGVGLSGGVETLCSQAFGMGNNYQAGKIYPRAQVVMTCFFIPQAIILCFATPILIATGQPQRSSELAGEFIIICLPGLWCWCQTELLRRFLGAQRVFHIIMNCQIINCGLHIVWAFTFVFWLDLGYHGIIYATLITFVMNFVLPYLYVTLNKSSVREGSWQFISRDSFRDLGEYLSYGIPSMLMFAFEGWAFEFLTFMVGIFGENELAVFVVCYNLVMYAYMVTVGFQLSINTLIGNSLGASKPKTARVYARVALISVLFLFIILAGSFYSFRYKLASVFVSEDLYDLFAYTLAMMVPLAFGDYLQSIGQGEIKAMGYQKWGTIICLIGYWGICIPLTYIFSFILNFQVTGVLLGMPIGLLFVGVSFQIIIYRTNFEELSKDIVARLRMSSSNLLEAQNGSQ
ncbi:unnamed protein product [Moneuplotes crassus]|uniref:Uncharacterized protein n=1 Tax=Euplotes crassus TaxID=5936 RepID=A0AAD1UH60_EUPCR|nr:unnamed protein product [Moneuplotes crassus]